MSVPVLSELINASPTLGIFVDGSGNIYALWAVRPSSAARSRPPSAFCPATSARPPWAARRRNQRDRPRFGLLGDGLQLPGLGSNRDLQGEPPDLALETNTSRVNGATVTPGTPIVPAVAEPGTFVLLAGAALCGGRFADAAQNDAGGSSRPALPARSWGGRASPWWKLSCRGGPPPGNVGHAEFLTKSFNTIHSFSFFVQSNF